MFTAYCSSGNMERISTAISGFIDFMRFNTSIPLCFGIERSSNVTSMSCSRTALSASSPLLASATISNSPVSSSKPRRPARNSAWSSAIITLVLSSMRCEPRDGIYCDRCCLRMLRDSMRLFCPTFVGNHVRLMLTTMLASKFTCA